MKPANKILRKNECCIQAYKKLASFGICLMFPVSIMSEMRRPDIETSYHLSLKVFDSEKDNLKEIKEIVSNLKLNPPNPKNIKLEFSTLPGRNGHTYHAINLHGHEVENLSKHFNKFSHMGFNQHKEFHPHIVVDEETWNYLNTKKFKTAHDAGIQFFPAELKNGEKILYTCNKTTKDMSKSESFLKNKGDSGMKLTSNDILTVHEIGTINKNPVKLLRTKGGYWIAVGRKKGSVSEEPLGAGSHSAIVKFNLEKQYPDFEPVLVKSESGFEPIVEKHSHFLNEDLKKSGHDIYSIQTGNDVEFQITKNNLKISGVNGKIDIDYLSLNNLSIPKQFTKALAGATVQKAVSCNVGLKIKE